MKTNGVATVLKVIGWVIGLAGCLTGFIIFGLSSEVRVFGISFMIASFISCMLFIGFAEVISLLQANLVKQEDIYKVLTSKERSNKSNVDDVIQDIENNLPNI